MEWLRKECPPDMQERLSLLVQYARCTHSGIVPDPYYGGAQGFEQVLDLLEDACEGLVEEIRRRLRHAVQELPESNPD